MAAEPLLSRLAAWSTFVVFPAAVIAHALSASDHNKNNEKDKDKKDAST